MMSKEVNKQTTIVFEPLTIESKFQKQLGIQIAFYRSIIFFIKHSDEKIKKTEPLKLTQPQKIYSFSKDSVMKLHTILNHNELQDKIQTKSFRIQVIFKIDGNKNSIEKQIDASHHYKKNKQINTLKLIQNPDTQLKFRIHIFLKDDREKDKIRQFESKIYVRSKQVKEETKLEDPRSITPIKNLPKTKSIPKPILKNKSMKVIRFEDEKDIQDEDDKELAQLRKAASAIGALQRFKSKPVQEQLPKNQIGNVKSTNKELQIKVDALEKQLTDKEKEIFKMNVKFSELQSKYQDLGVKFQKIKEKCAEITLQLQKEKLLSKNINNASQLSDNDLKKQRLKYETLQKQYKKLKQQILQLSKKLENKQNQTKKFGSQNIFLQQNIKKNEAKIKEFKQKNSELQKLLNQMESKSMKFVQNSSQQSIRLYKQRIRLLEKQNEDLQEQKNYAEQQSKSRNEEILGLKQKLKTINEKNLKLIEELSTKEYEIQKLEKKVKKSQEDLNNYKIKVKPNQPCSVDSQEQSDQKLNSNNYKELEYFKSQKYIGSDGTESLAKLKNQNAELKSKLSIALKNLQNKENLLRKFDAFAKEGRKQLEDELENLKRQNEELKEKEVSKQKNPKGDLMSLQWRIQVQKLRKQVEYKTKSQRQLLFEKSQLQARNKTLQQDVVRSKQWIANILNVIHEYNDEELIEEVNGFLG